MTAVTIVNAKHIDVLNLCANHDLGAGMFVVSAWSGGVTVEGPNTEHTQMALLTLAEKAREDGWAVVRAEWVHCSPALLSSGVSCAQAPRRPCPRPDGSHDHWVEAPA